MSTASTCSAPVRFPSLTWPPFSLFPSPTGVPLRASYKSFSRSCQCPASEVAFMLHLLRAIPMFWQSGLHVYRLMLRFSSHLIVLDRQSHVSLVVKNEAVAMGTFRRDAAAVDSRADQQRGRRHFQLPAHCGGAAARHLLPALGHTPKCRPGRCAPLPAASLSTLCRLTCAEPITTTWSLVRFSVESLSPSVPHKGIWGRAARSGGTFSLGLEVPPKIFIPLLAVLKCGPIYALPPPSKVAAWLKLKAALC